MFAGVSRHHSALPSATPSIPTSKDVSLAPTPAPRDGLEEDIGDALIRPAREADPAPPEHASKAPPALNEECLDTTAFSLSSELNVSEPRCEFSVLITCLGNINLLLASLAIASNVTELALQAAPVLSKRKGKDHDNKPPKKKKKKRDEIDDIFGF